MVDLKIGRYFVDGDQATLFYHIYRGDVTTEPELDVDTDQLVDVTRYRRTEVLSDQDITFTRAQAVSMIELLGGDPAGLRDHTMEQVYDTALPFLTQYLLGELVQFAASIGEQVYVES